MFVVNAKLVICVVDFNVETMDLNTEPVVTLNPLNNGTSVVTKY